MADNQNFFSGADRGLLLMQDCWLVEKMAPDDYTQAGGLFRLMPVDAQRRLFGSIARHMTLVPLETQLRAICHFFRADPNYGIGVAKALGLAIDRVMPNIGMSMSAALIQA